MIDVMIIDDSAVVLGTLTELLNAEPDMRVIATASDPYIAARKLNKIRPDVIVLDIEMPRMDGLTFLRKLMDQHPMPVVVCSSQVEEGSVNALQAREFGAADIIRKPRIGRKQFLEETSIVISDALRAACAAKPRHHWNRMIRGPQSSFTGPLGIETTAKVVVLGASTGGTEAIRIVLQGLPADCPGMVIVQHMPEHFTASFAQRLNSICPMTVKEAEDGDSVLRGRVLIAPGNKHTVLKRSGSRYFVTVKDGPLVCRHRPSVDVLFRSAARYAAGNAVGIMLTGMGADGAEAMMEMKKAGAVNLAQDENSCVVYGMPKEAVKAGAVDVQLPLTDIASWILQSVRSCE